MRMKVERGKKVTRLRWQASIIFVAVLVFALALPASAYELDKPGRSNAKEGCEYIQLDEEVAAKVLQQAKKEVINHFEEQGKVLTRDETGKLDKNLSEFIWEVFGKLAVRDIRETMGYDTLGSDVEQLAVNKVLADGYLLDYYLEKALELSGNLDEFFSILQGMGDARQGLAADTRNKDALGDIWQGATGAATAEPSTGGMLGDPSQYMSGNNNGLTLEEAALRTARNSAQIVRGVVQVVRGKPSGGRTIGEAWNDQNDLYDEVMGYNQDNDENESTESTSDEGDTSTNENEDNDDNSDNTNEDSADGENNEAENGKNNENNENEEGEEDTSRGGGCVLGECTCCHAPNRFGIGDDPREDNEPDSGHETVSDDYNEEGPRNPFGVGGETDDSFQFPEHYTGCDREDYPEATDRFGIVSKPEIQLDDPRVPLTNPTQPGLDWQGAY